MFKRNDRRALLWTCFAAAAAACLGREALAGNYVEVVATNNNIQYFSVALTTGQYVLCSNPNEAQLLIDDITYGIQLNPASTIVPVWGPLWSAPEFNATYELGAGATWFYSLFHPYYFYSFGAPPFTGLLPSGAFLTYDTETWSYSHFQQFGAELFEFDTTTGGFVRAFDQTAHTVDAALLARLEHVGAIGAANALGLGDTELLKTLSESRHFKTPHIVPIPDTFACSGVWGGVYTGIQVYVKGRVVVNAADALTENGSIVVY